MVMTGAYSNETSLCNEVWALVPARSGSKGIVDKNMQEVAGRSLLGLAVAAASSSKKIDRCFVSTDSEVYAAEASRYGAEVPFIRPEYAASDSASDLIVFEHFLAWAKSCLRRLPWAIVHLRPTTPCREPHVIDSAVEMAWNVIQNSSSIRSVHECSESPFKWFYRDSMGYLTTLDRARSLDSANSSRDQFEKIFVPNGYVDIIYPEKVLRTGNLHGDSVSPFFTEPTIEVDGSFELKLLREGNLLPQQLLRATADSARLHSEP